MRRPKSSILGLMTITLFVAVGLQSLRSASPGWSTVMDNATAGLLFFAAIRAWVGKTRDDRTWWFGFALFGWGYLVLVTGPARDSLVTRFVVDPLLLWTYDLWMPVAQPRASSRDIPANERYLFHLARVWRSIATIILAFAGAWLVSAIDRRSRRIEETGAEARSTGV